MIDIKQLVFLAYLLATDGKRKALAKILGNLYVEQYPTSVVHNGPVELFYEQEAVLNSDNHNSLTTFLTQQLEPFNELMHGYDKNIRFEYKKKNDRISPWNDPYMKISKLNGSGNVPHQHHTRTGVFLSHSSKDKVLAAKLSKYLSCIGFDCFVAHDSISGGSDWSAEIKSNLDSMRVFIACITEHFNNSIYCHQECGYAVAKGQNVKIIPLKFVKTNPAAMLYDIQAISIDKSRINGADIAKIYKASQSSPYVFHR